MEIFGAYLLLRELGRGGMGVVYVARSRLSDHPVVAVKKLRPDVAHVPSFKERFEHECQLALRLRHPRIVEVLDAGRVDGVPYIASELIVGKDLGAISRELVRQRQEVPVEVAIRIMIDVLAGLDYVHEAHDPNGAPMALVHRDVTPTNVIVGYDGVSRLADFGLAKSALTDQLQLTASGVILGTPKFIAPEVARGGIADRRSDVYGLGAVVYRLLAGRGPHEGGVFDVFEAVLRRPPVPLEQIRPELPSWLVQFVNRLMAANPADRPQSARDAGLVLVHEARRRNVLVQRGNVGEWLGRLFDGECTRQKQAYRRDCEIDARLVPDDDATRAVVLGSPLETRAVIGPASEHSETIRGALAALSQPSGRAAMTAPLPVLLRSSSRAELSPTATVRRTRPRSASRTWIHRKPAVSGLARGMVIILALAASAGCGLTGFFLGWVLAATGRP